MLNDVSGMIKGLIRQGLQRQSKDSEDEAAAINTDRLTIFYLKMSVKENN